MTSLSDDTCNQTDIIEAYKSTSRYQDALLNMDTPYFEGMVNQNQRYGQSNLPPEMQLNKANAPDTIDTSLNLHILST